MTTGDPAVPSESSSTRQWSPTGVIWTYFAWLLAPFLTVLFARDTPFGPQVKYLVVPAFYLATAVFLARYWYRLSWSDLGIPGEDAWRNLAVSIFLAVGYMLLSLAVAGPSPSEAAGNLLKLWRESKLRFAARLFFSPILEELFFRGVAFQVFARRYNPNRAIFVTSILFALAHLSLTQLPWLFFVGLVLGWFVQDPGSTLFAPIILHITLSFIHHMLQ
ncbi:MAG: lysostaphin resistance A-like protein [Anaerolineae bacterium]